MNWLTELFTETSIAHDILVYSLVIALGLAFGKLRIFGISFGVTWVLFFAIFFANIGLSVSPETLHFIKEFGLVLFVYFVGLQVGPSFFNSFRKEGISLNLLGLLTVVIGVATTVLFYLLSSNRADVMAGLMSGAVTNTPGLGAAQAVIEDPAFRDKGLDASEVSIAYAVTYPLGVVGIMLVLLFLKKVWKIDITKEQEAYNLSVETDPDKPVNINLHVSNPMLFDKTLSSLRSIIPDHFLVARLYQNDFIISPSDDMVLKKGDVLLVVAVKAVTEKLKTVVGEESPINLQEIPGKFERRNIVVTHSKATYSKLENIKELNRPDCRITRIERSGFELIPTPNLVLRIGDTVTVWGTQEGIHFYSGFLGNAVKKLEIPELAPVFLGIFLGIILGSIELTIPGIPAPIKIGLAGGPLIIALMISKFGNLVRIYNYTSNSANLMLRELGVALFLASIGLSSGKVLIMVFKNGKGAEWIAIGFIITVIPLLITGFAARLIAKKSFFQICGLLAGASTDPPALAFTLQLAGNSIPSQTYATVYPLVMIARIIAAELFVLFFIGH
jgi:putative transport protein